MAKIMILEDDVLEGHMLKALLDGAGHTTEAFASATEAYDALAQGGFDLVISDLIIRKYGKPVPDGGLVLIGRARALRQANNLKLGIIAISGAFQNNDSFDVLRVAERVGSDRSLAKPFSEHELMSAIDELLAEMDAAPSASGKA